MVLIQPLLRLCRQGQQVDQARLTRTLHPQSSISVPKRDQTKRETIHGDTFKVKVFALLKVVGRLDSVNDDHALDAYVPLTVGIVPRLCRKPQKKVMDNLRSRHSLLVPLLFDIVIPDFNAVLLYDDFVVSSRIDGKCRVFLTDTFTFLAHESLWNRQRSKLQQTRIYTSCGTNSRRFADSRPISQVTHPSFA